MSESKTFDFEGEMSPAQLPGFAYKDIFSPSESLDEMPKRMEERIKKVRKMRKNHIFADPYKAPSQK
ncbi:MAG: hypothetical protein IJ689_05700 [Alphaproteobacteria bacterium]|nr:hypothetical protein [Alphaproteobacteria bacterium]